MSLQDDGVQIGSGRKDHNPHSSETHTWGRDNQRNEETSLEELEHHPLCQHISTSRHNQVNQHYCTCKVRFQKQNGTYCSLNTYTVETKSQEQTSRIVEMKDLVQVNKLRYFFFCENTIDILLPTLY